MSQPYADSGYDASLLTTTTARLSQRESEGAAWHLTVLIPDEAFIRIEKSIEASTLERITLSLKLEKSYVLDSKDFLGQRQLGSTFRDRLAFFMLKDAESTSGQFCGEITGISMLGRRVTEREEGQ
jgi:hypothetical protein